MDITELYTVDAHESGSEMQVRGPDGKPLDMYITFVGCDSRKWAGIRRKYRDASIKAIKDSEGDSTGKVVADQLADAALGWRGFMSNGAELEFSRERLNELFLNAPYLREQADAFIGDRLNFTKG